jgi:hypothetical protein
MAKTVVGLIEDQAQARAAVEELQAAGIDRKDVGLISPEALARETSAAVSGASTGMLMGGLAGMLLAVAAVAIPGIGPVIVAGPAGALLGGTALGAIAGGLIGGLVKRGVPEDDAHLLAEGVRRGATLVTVTARTDAIAAKAVEIMKRHGAVDLEQRAAEWKEQGWTGRMKETTDEPGVPARENAAASASAPAKEAASGAAPAPGIATVCVYDFEIVEPVVTRAYNGPERRAKNIPHDPERRLAA